MGEALIEAAAEAGIRITLLDACYLAGGFGEPLEGPQLRFSDGDADAWAERVEALRAAPTTPGSARRSTPSARCRRTSSPRSSAGRASATRRCTSTSPSSAPRTRPAWPPTAARPTRAARRARRARRRARAPSTPPTSPTADIALLGGAATAICMCPTTERDLADGIGPAARSRRRRAAVLGSDSHARDRPVRGGARGRARRAAAHPSAAATSPPPSCCAPRARRPRRARLARRRARSSPARPPTS